jgi:hypothetical protein
MHFVSVSWGSTVTTLWAGRPINCPSVPGRDKRFLSSLLVSTPALRPTQPPTDWEQGLTPRGKATRS